VFDMSMWVESPSGLSARPARQLVVAAGVGFGSFCRVARTGPEVLEVSGVNFIGTAGPSRCNVARRW
jgi:phosphotransferase system HPr-like phosphotransfer protein